MIEHYDQKQLGEERLAGHSSSSRDTMAKAQGDQGRTLLTGLSHLFSYLSIQPRTTCLGTAPPTVGWALRHQSATEKMPLWCAHGPICWKQFLSWDFLCPGRSDWTNKPIQQWASVLSHGCWGGIQGTTPAHRHSRHSQVSAAPLSNTDANWLPQGQLTSILNNRYFI